MNDLRFALRLIGKNRVFSLTVIVILALCIGANTAVLQPEELFGRRCVPACFGCLAA